jgi:ribonuclease R
MSKKTNQKEQKNKSTLLKDILAAFNRNPRSIYNYKQLAVLVNAHTEAEKILINHVLQELKSQDYIEERERGKFHLKFREKHIEGKIEITQTGSGFVITEASTKDIFIAQRGINTAQNGDTVKVYVFPTRGNRPEGEVVEVIKRAKEEFVGIIELSKNFAFLTPSNRNGVDIFIPLQKLNGAVNGDKAVAKVTDWYGSGKNPTGEITRVLGKPGDNNAEMNAIMIEYGLPVEFPADVEQEAKDISLNISKEEISKRRDFRGITTFTIDPADAKDFDDALSIQKLANNNWEIGVHIADVSHYVKPGTLLDDEAVNRATSVYLVDRVVPMLPEILSNHVCSLRPNEEKLCFSAVFEISEEAEIINQWFGRTIILSDKRFSYEDAQLVLETQQGEYVEELLTLDKLAKKLRENRFKDGSIAFEKSEVKFNLDSDGKPLGVYFKEAKDSNKLIEDFMLLANRKVAEYCGKTTNKIEAAKQKTKKTSKRPMVYRVHDNPNIDKLNDFSLFVARFGYKLKTSSHDQIANGMNKLLQDVAGKKEAAMIEQLAIRTMAKAIYTTDNIGHYGLAFDYYTHFTSPIRRYPDVMVHRLLQQYLDEDNHLSGEKNKKTSVDELEQLCKHSSDMERLAAEAERSSVKYKQVEFLSDKTGQDFEGLISGVTEYGMYVEIIENHCEGMVKAKDLTDDTYAYDPDNFSYCGRKSKRIYQLGDKVLIKIKRCDLSRKQVDFTLLKKLE